MSCTHIMDLVDLADIAVASCMLESPTHKIAKQYWTDSIVNSVHDFWSIFELLWTTRSIPGQEQQP